MFAKENANRPTEQMIFPSVPTAQMVLESTLMTSELAENALNIGGIKADGNWNGEVYKKLTKEQNEKGEEHEIFADFKKYSSLEEYVADYYNRMQQSDWMKERYENYYVVNSKDQKTALKK